MRSEVDPKISGVWQDRLELLLDLTEVDEIVMKGVDVDSFD